MAGTSGMSPWAQTGGRYPMGSDSWLRVVKWDRVTVLPESRRAVTVLPFTLTAMVGHLEV